MAYIQVSLVRMASSFDSAGLNVLDSRPVIVSRRMSVSAGQHVPADGIFPYATPTLDLGETFDRLVWRVAVVGSNATDRVYIEFGNNATPSADPSESTAGSLLLPDGVHFFRPSGWTDFVAVGCY